MHHHQTRIIVMLITSLLFCLDARAQSGDEEVIKKYLADFKNNIDSSSVDDRVGAVKGLKYADCAKAAELLVDLLHEKDPIVPVAACEILKGYRSEEAVKVILTEGFLGRRPAARKWSALALGYMYDPGPEAKAALLDALKKKSLDFEVHLAVVRALGRQKVAEAGPLILPEIRHKDPRMRMEAAYAISRIKPEGALKAVASLIDDKIWQVRVQAVNRLGWMKDRAIVPILIRRLARENGRLREDIIDILTKMTRLDYGLDVKRWDAWWKASGEAFLKSDEKAKRRRYKKPVYASGYFSISTYSKSYIFIIDLSKSMEWTIVPAKSYGYGFKEVQRLELAKKELVKLIDTMESDTAFNIVHFMGNPDSWKETLISATKENKREALDYVKQMNVWESNWVDARKGYLQTATNIYGALDMVFTWAEESFGRKRAGTPVDTIFLLTDGMPAGPDWLTDRDAIPWVIEERNRYLKIRIHTISLTDDAQSPVFLGQLSKPNGGECRDVLKE